MTEERKFEFCPTFADWPTGDLVDECSTCGRLYGVCCSHPNTVCHHHQLVFTDGAVSNNGRDSARAGLGISMGGDEVSWSIFVDDAVDPGAPRTNQRAELLAAIEGLRNLHQYNADNGLGHFKKSTKRHKKEDNAQYVVVTDSEYVVKGITEWFPSWRGRGWRTSDNRRPTNLDLFMKLDEYVSGLERAGIEVGFWHVPRAHNKKADSLAKRATRI